MVTVRIYRMPQGPTHPPAFIDGADYSLPDVLWRVIREFEPAPRVETSCALLPNLLTGEAAEILASRVLPYLLQNSFEAIEGQGCVDVGAWATADAQGFVLSDCGRFSGNVHKLGEFGYSTKGNGRGRGIFFAGLYTRALSGSLDFAVTSTGGLESRIVLPLNPHISYDVMDF